jgi:AraC-like DNA-binding protein
MLDPLTEVVTLLQPGVPVSKIASGAGAWSVSRTELDRLFFCVILDGACLLEAPGQQPLTLQAGDFVLIPATQGFTISGRGAAQEGDPDPTMVAVLPGETRHGRQHGPADVRLLVGHCEFGSPDATLLVSLLPDLVHVRGEARLTALVQMVVDECRAQRTGRDAVLARLLDVLLIEALRSGGTSAAPGLVRGLADERLAVAIRRMHEEPARSWTVSQLAGEAALSRSTFFERFSNAIGMAPMEYLLAWRMALAKRMLLRQEARIAEVAQRVGYGSASAFSVAFARHAGTPPARFARESTVLAETAK